MTETTSPKVSPLDFDVTDADLKELLRRSYARGAFVGGCVAVMRDGTSHAVSIGTAAVDDGSQLAKETRFPFACLVDVVLYLVGSMLASKGKFDWNRSVTHYLDTTPRLRSHFKRVTARHLSIHSSGLDNEPGFSDANGSTEVAENFGGPALFEPGQLFARSSCNRRLLFLVLDRIEPNCVDSYLRRCLGDYDAYPEAIGHVQQPGAASNVFLSRSTAKSHWFVDAVALGAVDMTRVGQLFIDSMPPTPDVPSYEIADAAALPRLAPIWCSFPGQSFYCTARYPGFNVFLLISPLSRLVIAAVVNTATNDLWSDLLTMTNLRAVIAPGLRAQRTLSVTDCGWHAVTEPRLLSGKYVAHGEAMIVRDCGDNLQLTGRQSVDSVIEEFNNTTFYPQNNGTFSTSNNREQNRALTTGEFRVRFICNGERGSSPGWLRLGDDVFRRQ